MANDFMQAAIDEARHGEREGGIPIGSVLDSMARDSWNHRVLLGPDDAKTSVRLQLNLSVGQTSERRCGHEHARRY